MLEEVVGASILLEAEVKRVLEHLKFKISIGILLKLLKLENPEGIGGDSGKRRWILLEVVLKDGLVESTVGGKMAGLKQSVETVKRGLNGLLVDHKEV